MPIVAGADGCHDGWCCVVKDTATGQYDHRFFELAHDLIFQTPTPGVLMIDIPIGLSNVNPRQCDGMARTLLGNRHVCVFSAPIRPIFAATTRQQASLISQAANGRRVTCQTWAITPKIREVDAVLSADCKLQTRVFEVHPEVSFCEWNGGVPFQVRKKSQAGKAARQALIGNRLFAAARSAFTRRQAGDDDIADAFAALWTAERKLQGNALVIPGNPDIDPNGLRMEIWR